MDHNIKQILVRAGDSLGKILSAMGSSGVGIALVVNDTGRLIGVATDGDVRRALLRGADLTESIESVVTPDPVVLGEGRGNGDAEVLRLLRSEGYQRRHPRFIPVVDGEGRPRRLVLAEELLQPDVAAHHRNRPAAARWLGEILVIGGAGYIGSVLVRQLLQAGYRVKVLDLFLYGNESLSGIGADAGLQLVRGDTRHIETLVSAIQSAGGVVHLAELVGDPLCARNPALTLQTNYLSTLAIARICSHLQISRFVYVSSCSVYGATTDPDRAVDEDADLAPVSLYAKTKINSERAILSMTNGQYSPCILRLGTVFGSSPRPRFDLVVNALTARAFFEREILVLGGDQWRPHVHVSDAAHAVRLALEAPVERVAGQVFNVVGENCRIEDLGELVRARLPGTNLLHDREATDQRSYRVAGDKAGRVLGFRPRVTVADGIDELARHFETGSIVNHKDKRYYNAQALSDWERREAQETSSADQADRHLVSV